MTPHTLDEIEEDPLPQETSSDEEDSSEEESAAEESSDAEESRVENIIVSSVVAC